MAGAANWWDTDAHAPSITGVIPAAKPKPSEILRDKRTTQEIENNPLDVEVKRQSLKKSRTDQALSMAQDYNSNPDVKAYNSILPTYAAALESPDTPAGDQGLVYAMAKVMQADGSAVRSEEVQNTESLQPYIDQIKAKFGKQMNGDGTFLPPARKQIREAMAQKMAFLNRAYINQRVRYKEQADRAGLDPRDVVGEHTGIGFQETEARFLGRPVSKADYRGNVIPAPRANEKPPAGGPPAPDSAGPQLSPKVGNDYPSAPPIAPAGSDTKQMQIPPEMQQEYDAWLAEKGRNFDPHDYALMRLTLDKKYGFGLTPETMKTYLDEGAKYADPSTNFNHRIPGPETSMTSGEQGRSDFVQTPVGTGLANYFNTATAGIPQAMAGETGRAGMDFINEQNPKSAFAGGLAGGLTGALATDGALNFASRGLQLGAKGAARLTSPVSNAALYSGALGYNTAPEGDGIQNAILGATIGGATAKLLPPALSGIGAVYSKVKAPITAARDAAERLKINSTPATTGGPMSQGIQMAYGNLPGSSAAVENAAARETGDLANAARSVANDLGPVSNPKGAGKALSRGAGAWERVTRKEAQRLYGERDKLMGGPDVPIPMVESRAAIDSFAQRFPNSPVLATLRESPAVRRLEKALPDKGVLTLKESTEILSEARAALRNARRKGDVTPAMEARIAEVEQAIENDVLNAARQIDQAAGRTTGGAVDAQITADKYYRNRAILKSGALKLPLSSRMDDVMASSESVYRDLSGDMAEKGGNFAKLQATWKALPTGAKRNFAATKFDEMGKATNGQQNADKTAWSFNTFLTNYSDLNADARKLVFGAQEDKIRDIATYAERLRQVDKSRNFSNTAKNTIAGAFMTVLGSALWKGDVQTAAATVAAVPAAWGSAKLFLSTPAMRTWTARALKATQQATNTGNAAPLKSLTSQLSGIAAREPAISGDVINLQNYLSQAFNQAPLRAAAGPENQKHDRRPPPENNGQ